MLVFSCIVYCIVLYIVLVFRVLLCIIVTWWGWTWWSGWLNTLHKCFHAVGWVSIRPVKITVSKMMYDVSSGTSDLTRPTTTQPSRTDGRYQGVTVPLARFFGIPAPNKVRVSLTPRGGDVLPLWPRSSYWLSATATEARDKRRVSQDSGGSSRRVMVSHYD